MVDLSAYTLTFADEFDTRSISQTGDQATWASIRSDWRLDEHSDLGFGASSFVDASSGYDPFRVSDGVLTITARPDSTPYGAPGNWESGLISTQGNFSQTYGYFEMRANLSDHTRAWDAFWLLPDEQAPNPENRPGWQEIDVVEHYGNHNIGTYSWIHTTDPHADAASELQVYGEHASQVSGFHTYGLAWTAETITFYYDGVAIGSKPTPSDMHGPMHVLANLAVQPGVGGAGEPMEMQIDYIRVYSANAPDEPGDPDPVAGGTDELIVKVSQDWYLGDAEFLVRIDGQQIGVPRNGRDGVITLNGEFGDAPGEVSIEFINDLYHGSADADRNLSVEGIVYNGTAYAAASARIEGGWNLPDRAFLHSTGSTATFALGQDAPAPPLPPPPATAGQDEITLSLSQDAYLGDAQFIIKVDGLQVGGVQSAATPFVTINGSFGEPQSIAVEFINDLYHGSAATDRNLHVEQMSYNGATYAGASGAISDGWTDGGKAVLVSSGSSVTFSVSPVGAEPVAGADQISLQIAQDAYLGDAQFIVRIDGQQIGSVQSAGEGPFNFTGDFGEGPREISIEFINDLYHGTASTDRNLYVQSLTYNGETYAGAAGAIIGGSALDGSAFLYGDGSTVSFQIIDRTPASMGWLVT